VKNLKFVISIRADTMYMRSQVDAARTAAGRLGVQLEISQKVGRLEGRSILFRRTGRRPLRRAYHTA
jgi:hypothetical protein